MALRKKKPPVEDVSACVVEKALRERYAPPQWAFFTQVKPSTGWRGPDRYADALALDTWPSSGMELHGFEIKVSRGDWLRELKDPSKADALARYCDRWWIAAPKGLVQVEELPKTWGLYEYAGGKLRAKVRGGLIEAVPVDRGLVAMLLRRAWEEIEQIRVESVPVGQVEAQVAALVKEQMSRSDDGRLKRAHHRLVEDVKAFEEATGLAVINGYGGHPSREVLEIAVSALREGESASRSAERAAASLMNTIKNMERSLEAALALRKRVLSQGEALESAKTGAVVGLTGDLFSED